MLLVFDKALDESNYSFMYAQLCLRLNDYGPLHSHTDEQQGGNFRKLLLFKCKEEFRNRRRATADLESRCGEVLTLEQEEQVMLAKRKMLGNIKFVGELYKVGVLHEAIIHSCIKELLERRRGQSVEHTSQSVECLCHFMTTVGSKLDTSKAKSWMDSYFARMFDYSLNKDLPSRIRFMLMDVIELRKSSWVPRRAADSSPRPIHLIRNEVYQEKKVAGSGGRGHGGAGPSAAHSHMYTLDMVQQHEIRGQSSSQYVGVSGDEGFTSSPYVQDPLASPQDHQTMSFTSHTATPLLHSAMAPNPSSDISPTLASGKGVDKKKIRKLSSKSENTVSLRPAMQSLKIGPSSSRHKLAAATTPTSMDHTLLQPDAANNPEGNLDRIPGKAVAPVHKMHIPRTRDDSSDEEDQVQVQPPLGVLPTPHSMGGGHVHMPPHPYPGGGNFPLPHHHLPPHHHHHMPSGHMIHPQPPPQQAPHFRGSPGGPEHFQVRASSRGLIGPGPLPPHPPPRGMGGVAGQGLLPHQPHPPMMYMGQQPPQGSRPLSGPPGMMPYPPPPNPSGQGGLAPITMGGPAPRGYFPPRSSPVVHQFAPHGSSHMPSHVPGYGQLARLPHPGTGWNAPGQEVPRPPSNPGDPEVEKHGRPPNLERNEPVIKYKQSRKSGGGKKGTQDEKDKMVESLIKDYLRTRDVDKAVEGVKGQLGSISKENLCVFCISKTLEKSEDDRTYMSRLLQELHSREVISSQQLLQALTAVLNSSQRAEPQNKTYLAGFIARAVAKDLLTLKMVCPLFDQGAHHPTILVLLQALTALLGESEVLQRFKASDLHLTMLLPVEFRSHSALSAVVESKHLSFLYPLKRIQSELAAKLKQEASALPIYRWIRANVDQSLYPTADFVMILTRCILEHVTSSSSLGPASSSTDTPTKDMVAKEKELMEKFKVLVEKFVSDHDSLQVSVLYATQIFCHDKHFPKGLLLRIFSYWYDMDVIEEESFFKWKEDVPQEYPGKGQALFQVNQWLVLLAESDDEDPSSDEES